MKKNLRIVSASAAALLAIAPVAASTVNVANADVEYGNATQPTPVAKNTVAVNIDLGDIVGMKVSDVVDSAGNPTASEFNRLKVTLKTSDGTNPTLHNKLTANDIKLTKGDGTALNPTDTIEPGSYKIVINNMVIDNLINSKTYKAAAKNGEFSGTDITAGEGLGSAFNNATGVTYTETFNIFDTKNTTTPYFVNAKSGVQIARDGQLAGNQAFNNGDTIATLDTAINNLVKAHDGSIITTDDDLIDQLTANKDVTLSGTGSAATIKIDEGKTFTVKVTAQNPTSGKKTTVDITFKRDAGVEYAKHPVITLFENGDAQKPYTSTTSAEAIQAGDHTYDNSAVITVKNPKDGSQFKPTDYLKAAINVANAGLPSSGNSNTVTPLSAIWTNDFSVVSNTVNMDKSGVYSVTVSAKNDAGLETKATIPVVVLKDNAEKMQTIKNEPGYPVTVYNFVDGKMVKSENNYNNLYNGHAVATFETKTVDGKSYTRIQTVNDTTGEVQDTPNLWVESDKLSDYKPATEESQSTRVMYKSAVYNKDGKTTGDTISGYKDADLVTENGKLKEFHITINGKESVMYKLANKDGYVRARNVTGSKMTLKKNAYVYKSNGKRANKKTLKKHSTITVYGGQYKAIKGYKGKAVRIGVNQYVKVANVNYKLAD